MNAIQMTGITKRFGDLVANDNVDFELKAGEIHALLGENGAGKTTLMRILYGLYHADEGDIQVNGRRVSIVSPKDAIHNRIGMVTQHFTLVSTLTVAENLTLGEKGSITINKRTIEQKISDAAEQYGIPVKPDALISSLSVGERQRVEILKALNRNAKVLILDEPTAVLVPQEVDVLFEVLERLRKSGLSVVFISHKLNEVMALCDRISVLRLGKMAGTVVKGETNKTELACMMVGHETFGVKRQGKAPRGKVILRVENLSLRDKKGLDTLRDVSFEVHTGEILGIAGVSGNGQSELTGILSGTIKPTGGQFHLEDRNLTGTEPLQITRAGIGRIAEDRHASLVGELTVAENIALEYLDEFVSHGVLDRKKIHQNAEKLIKEYDIKARPEDRLRTLSGGNMQKVILARTLSREPKFVLASQPTRGLDVGATDYVDHRLLDQRDRGAAVLLLSEDLDEIMSLSDRVAVIYEGQIVGILPIEEVTREKLGLMMCGSIGKQKT
ncbi:MAG: ABC transporter ATP-binding protein [Anaerolineaceae bacterium]|nr:ABC transporter ATP-binding protein [Anaerolineaceae bacterium]MBN2677871.1 ABC transporter ATP-binding protein [Anaerolineaceae bacterium]